MNKHSLELLKKAGAKITGAETGTQVDTTSLNVEKLIELIVRDCASIVEQGYGSANFGNGSSGFELLERFNIEYKKKKNR